MSESRNKIVGRLRIAREHSGLSQGQVAKLLDYHRPTISEIEAGRRRVTADELTEFARIYDVSVGWLAANEEEDIDPTIELAARELAKLKKEDLDRVLRVVASFRKKGEHPKK